MPPVRTTRDSRPPTKGHDDPNHPTSTTRRQRQNNISYCYYNEPLPFKPKDGISYQPEDHFLAFSQQPISGRYPPRALLPHNVHDFKPPLLRYGWRIGSKKLMDIVRVFFPSVVVKRAGGDFFTDDGRATSESDSKDDGRATSESDSKDAAGELEESTYDTLYSPALIRAICAHYRINKNGARLIRIEPLRDSNGVVDTGLTVGSNYGVVLKGHFRTMLQVLVSPNEEPQWYLHPTNWKWTKKSATLQTRQTAKTMATTVPAVLSARRAPIS